MESNPSPSGVRLPKSVGRYRIDARLGRGAMGVVYRAFDETMNRAVAIKVMNTDVESVDETAARFYREAYSAGQLVHRNLVTVFDVGTDEAGRPFLVMELLEGGTLGDFLARPGVRLEDKLELMQQLCAGLHAAHTRGIFHRDIKPDNLLLTDEGELKIVDFGIARLAKSSLTTVGLIVGTPDYMAPEQALGEPVDARSDVFSTGAVFYFALTGRKPFAGSDVHTVLDAVVSADPLPIRDSEAPAAVTALVRRALAKLPDDRYPSAAAMAADVQRASRDLLADAERLADAADAALDALVPDSDRRDALCGELEAEPFAMSVGDYHADLAHRRAEAPARPRGTPDSSDWAGATQRAAEVEGLGEALRAELAGLSRAAAELHRGEQAARAGDLPAAIAAFEGTLRAAPSSAKAKQLMAEARRLAAERQAAQERAQALFAEAQKSAVRSDWTTVQALTGQALDVDPTHRAAAALRDQAAAAKRADEQARRHRSELALLRAEKLAQRGDFDEAADAVDEAKELDPDSPLIATVAVRVRNAKLDAERASAAERRAAEAIAAATALFERGEHAKALADLTGFLAREPRASSVSAAMTRLRAEAERLAAEARRAAAAAESMAAAEAALLADNPDRALMLAREALDLVPRDARARQVESVAAARVRERTVAKQRQDAADNAMTRASDELARGAFEAARELAREAAALAPDDPAPTDLLATILAEEAEADERVRQADEARQRAAAAAPVMALARNAEASADLIRAQWLAENALALDEACDEARTLIARVQATLSAQPSLGEETVRLGTGAKALDPDDTITLRPAVSTWRRFGRTLIERLKAPLRGRLSSRDLGGPSH